MGQPKESSDKKKNGVPSSLAAKKRRPRLLSPQQESFCIRRALGRAVEGAAAELGVSASTAWKWMRLERVQVRIEHYKQKNDAEEYKSVRAEYKLSLSHADVQMTRIASAEKPHKFRGFADSVKAGELIYRRLKAIEPTTRSSAVAVAGAVANAAVTGSTVRERYKALWLVQKEEEMRRQCEAEFTKTLDGTTSSGPDAPPNS